MSLEFGAEVLENEQIWFILQKGFEIFDQRINFDLSNLMGQMSPFHKRKSLCDFVT